MKTSGVQLFIQQDNSFKYINNSDLLPLIEGKNYYYTKGSWTRDKNILYLNSYSDSLIEDSVTITDFKTNGLQSSFTFFSPEGDTIHFYWVNKNNELIAGRFHSSFKSIEITVNQGDTLTFSFVLGYAPFTIITPGSDNRNYNIYLQRMFYGGHFNSSKFLIKRNKLRDINTREKYKKMKSE
jgi:hypothetical protein